MTLQPLTERWARDIIDEYHLTSKDLWNIVRRSADSVVIAKHDMTTPLGDIIKMRLRDANSLPQLLAQVACNDGLVDVDMKRLFKYSKPLANYPEPYEVLVELAAAVVLETIMRLLPAPQPDSVLV